MRTNNNVGATGGRPYGVRPFYHHAYQDHKGNHRGLSLQITETYYSSASTKLNQQRRKQ
jgi:hypothetical protein